MNVSYALRSPRKRLVKQIYEYIAKQLNDHENQCHGVKQGSYVVWSLDHIKDAVQCALDYLFSIYPTAFPTTIHTLNQKEDSCIIDLSCVGCKVLEVIRVGHEQCDNTTIQSTTETNNLLTMLDTSCIAPTTTEDKQYTLRQLANDKYIADSIIPEDTPIDFLCTSPTEELPAAFIREYSSIIKNYALWQLLLTDNESRTNQPRWESYFNALKMFVEMKLLLEFSLKEDDYYLGRRLVDDQG